MSCRSTPLSSAMTSYAKCMTPYFSDSQVQSLYHGLKAEAEIDSSETADEEEYQKFIETLSYRIRNDESLSDKRRESLLARLEAAATSSPVDARTWEAVNGLSEKVDLARIQYERMLSSVSSSFSISNEKVHELIQEARGGSWAGSGAFEDYSNYPDEFRFDLMPGLPKDQASQKAFRKLGYAVFLAQPYPVFVYGTLRQGQGNNRVVNGGAESYHRATLPGVGVYGAHRGFPYAAEHTSAFTIGEVVMLRNDASGLDARQSMDWLEGFNSNRPSHSHYERCLMTAELDGAKKIDVWVYLARGSSKSQLQESDLISHGDWVEAKNNYRDPSYIRAWNLGA